MHEVNCYFSILHSLMVYLFLALSSEGSNLTPAHHYSDFRFKTYAPIAFRYFRELFGIRPDDYLVSINPKAYSAMFTTAVFETLHTAYIFSGLSKHDPLLEK